LEEPKFQTLGPLQLVGFHSPFIHILSPDANGAEKVGPLWQQILSRHEEVPDRANHNFYGVIWGEPEDQRSHQHELHYLAGVAVEQIGQLPEGMEKCEVPQTQFAFVTHHGSLDTLGKTIHDLYRVWLEQSDFEHSGIADLEIYDQRFDPHGEDSQFDYGISIKPRESDKASAT